MPGAHRVAPAAAWLIIAAITAQVCGFHLARRRQAAP
jgi:hypothetical protein